MKKFFDKLVECTCSGRKELEKIKLKEDNLLENLDNQIIGQQFFDDEMEKYTEIKKEIFTYFKSEMDAISDEFQDFQDERYRLNGKNITPDIQLLNGQFDLSQQEIDNLDKKYEDNFTMRNAIEKYARNHNLKFINQLSHTKETSENVAFNDFLDFCKHCLIDDTLYANMSELYKHSCQITENN